MAKKDQGCLFSVLFGLLLTLASGGLYGIRLIFRALIKNFRKHQGDYYGFW